MKKTKIICTIGPGCDNRETLKQLVLNGMDTARFNFSHGSHEEHKKRYLLLREVAEEVQIPVAALLDTKGPEIRTGLLKGGQKVTLQTGQEFILTTEEMTGDEHGVWINYDGLNEDAKDVKVNFPQIFSRIKSNASKYYGESSTLMTEYINGQCKYFRTIEMSYLRSASNPTINYNYALLYYVFYSGVNLDDFMFFVPDAKIASSVNNYIIMSCGSYVFTFKDKVLVKM